MSHINSMKRKLETGHSPTPQFFRNLRQNNKHSSIKELEIDGSITDDQQRIRNHVLHHYQEVLEKQSDQQQVTYSLPYLLEKYKLKLPEISQESAHCLQEPISNSHIAEAIKALKTSSSP